MWCSIMLEQTRVGSSKLEYARAYSRMPRPLEQGAKFARVLEHRSPLGSSMLVCNTNSAHSIAINGAIFQIGKRTLHVVVSLFLFLLSGGMEFQWVINHRVTVACPTISYYTNLTPQPHNFY